MSPSWDFVTIERRGRVAVVRFDRSDGMNPMSVQLIRELTEAARSFEDDTETTAVVLAGTPGGFCAGRDLRDPEVMDRGAKPMHERRRLMGAGARLCRAWEEMEPLTIAAIERFAIGAGVAIAVACDLRVMGEGAHLRAPEVSLGLSMSWGSIPRLVALIGPARTKQVLIQSADRVSARDAHAWGLVQEVVPDGTALDHAIAMAEKAAAMPPVTVRMTKQSVNAVALALAQTAIHMDTDQVMLAETTEDHREAVAAFKAKRPARFTGA